MRRIPSKQTGHLQRLSRRQSSQFKPNSVIGVCLQTISPTQVKTSRTVWVWCRPRALAQQHIFNAFNIIVNVIIWLLFPPTWHYWWIFICFIGSRTPFLVGSKAEEGVNWIAFLIAVNEIFVKYKSEYFLIFLLCAHNHNVICNYIHRVMIYIYQFYKMTLLNVCSIALFI